MTKIPQLSFDQVVDRLRQAPAPSRQGYLCMYSTWLGGIVKDPNLMMVPVDDHLVHRGDGVFEAIKSTPHGIYALEPHLDRLFVSADKIGLKIPHSRKEMSEICVETVKASGSKDVLLRLYVSRGPGGFTTNPYECIASQMYLVITPFKPYPAAKYESGVTAKISRIAVKEGFFANVKSCNYLPNVLMKKESVDAGVDYTVSVDEKGNLAEGSTENFGIVSAEGELLIPNFDRILKGITATRAMQLAEKLVASDRVRAVKNAHITREAAMKAKEAFFLGTTLDCLPVTTFEGKPVADGKVGPVCKELLALIREDMRSGPYVTHV